MLGLGQKFKGHFIQYMGQNLLLRKPNHDVFLRKYCVRQKTTLDLLAGSYVKIFHHQPAEKPAEATSLPKEAKY